MDNSVAKVTLEKSRVHNFIKSKISGKKNILGNKERWIRVRLNLVKKCIYYLCIVVKYIHGKQVIYLYII